MRAPAFTIVIGALLLSVGPSPAGPFSDAFDHVLERIAWKKAELEELDEPAGLRAAKALGKLLKKAAKPHRDLKADLKLAKGIVKTLEKHFDDAVMISALDGMLSDLGTVIRDEREYLESWCGSLPEGKAREKAGKLVEQGGAFLVMYAEEVESRILGLKWLKKALAKLGSARKKLGKLGEPPPPTSRDPVLVYLADQATDDRLELWRTDATTGNPTRLNGLLPAGGGVTNFRVSPDGNLVAYTADQETDGVTELYVARVRGTGWYRVSADLGPDGDVLGYRWSPDSSTIAYEARDADGVLEVHVAVADGSGHQKVSGPLPDGHVASLPFQGDQDPWALDGSRIAYQVTRVAGNLTELFSTRPDGTENVRVTPALIGAGRGVLAWQWTWSPDSSRIAYVADQDTDGVYDLYAAMADGSGQARLSGAMPATGEVKMFAWAPDSSRIAYSADQDTPDVVELYTSMPDGTGNTKVSRPLPAGGNVENLWIVWAPDSSRVAYRADQDTDGVIELYTVEPDGTGNARVNDPLPAGSEVYSQFHWSADSSRICYDAREGIRREVHVGAADGGGSVKVSIDLPDGGSCKLGWRTDHVWSMDTRLAYSAAHYTDNVVELYTVDPDGTGGTKVSGALAPGGNVLDFAAWSPSPDLFRIAYMADQDTDGVRELYTSIGSGGGNVKVSGPMVPGGNVLDFAWAR